MQNTLPNNKTPHSSQNIFLKQPKKPKTNNSYNKNSKESTDVRQDKGFLTQALSASRQPAPLTKDSRAEDLYSKTTRIQKTNPARVKLVHTTFWLHPLVRAELERIAEREILTLSQVGAAACEHYVRDSIERQQSALLETKMRQIIREELTAFGNRVVFFLLKIAFPIEQVKILSTNVLKWVCKLVGLDLKAYYKMVDESANLARRNIFAKSPQLKDMMGKWESIFTDDEKTAKVEHKPNGRKDTVH